MTRRLRLQFWLTRRATWVLARLGQRERVIAWRRERARRERLAAEAAGCHRLSFPALHDMDRKLDRIIDKDGGFFIEAGGNDGYTQSNTYWLERFRGWSGVLVEPVPELVAEARIERPQSTVVQAALVPADHPEPTVRMTFGDLMTVVQGVHENEKEWTSAGLMLGWRDPYECDVPARALSDILDEIGAPADIDLLSLDVEGFEVQALRGLDLERHAPRHILVEMHDVDELRPPVEEILGDRYAFAEQLSPVDVLYVRADVSAS
jgi:FkbM family methyltransferase